MKNSWFFRLFASFAKDATDIAQAVKDVLKSPPVDPTRWAETPPDWWHSKAVRSAQMPQNGERPEAKEGGFAVGFDGSLIYSNGKTAAEIAGWKDVGEGGEVTEYDYGEMLAYVPKLTNVTLAKQIKPLWRKGKKYRDIAVLVGVSEQYVKYYCACFERANRTSNASPIEVPG